jgi:lipoprotein NlpI
MLAVAAHAPSNPEAQVVLGVLYNISQDFDNATECFSRAIELSPPDYTLLNKVTQTFFMSVAVRFLFLRSLSSQ